MKTDLDAAKHYFNDNLTDSYKRHDPQGWNLSHGLYFLAESLQRIEDQLNAIENRLDAAGIAKVQSKS
jgi:hypothetical protein